VTRTQIEDGLRALVRARILYGWYSWRWSDGRRWTVCPPPDSGTTQTFTQEQVVDYLRFAEGLAA
jgi:hypothetical protein